VDWSDSQERRERADDVTDRRSPQGDGELARRVPQGRGYALRVNYNSKECPCFAALNPLSIQEIDSGHYTIGIQLDC
jgi:hypothetical protein